MIKPTYPVPTSYETRDLLKKRSKSTKRRGRSELEKIKQQLEHDK